MPLVDPTEISQRFDRIVSEVGRVVVGQDEMIEHTLWALMARGHVLIEGVPGLGKTLLVRTLAHVLGVGTKRVQFTPDLMPSDVTGGNVFNQRAGAFEFVPGPVFTELLLADEINRSPAKTQAALLEAMQDRGVTTDGQSRPLPELFIVIATQNPVESQGTYPLPEAQLDRFLLKLEVRHPERAAERQILDNYVRGFDPAALGEVGLAQIVSGAELLAMQKATRAIHVEPDVLDYITDIVGRTRRHAAVYLGASPRGSVALLGVARARALSMGRQFVTPDDVKTVAPAVLRHRLLLHPDAELEDVTSDRCIDAVLRDAPVPRSAA